MSRGRSGADQEDRDRLRKERLFQTGFCGPFKGICCTCYSISPYFFLRFYLFIFRDEKEGRKRRREREGEEHQCVVVSCASPTRDPPATQACALTGNRTGDPLVHRLGLSPLSHRSRGQMILLLQMMSEVAVHSA